MDESSLKSKTVLVTGAAKRIGREICRSLASEGANIVVHYHRSQAEANQLCRELKDLGVKAWAISADFEKPKEYESLLDRAQDVAGRINALVNNASIFPPGTLEDLTLKSIEHNLEVNAWVPFVLGRGFAKTFGQGSIVNLVDSRVASHDWAHVAYILSKHVLSALTEMMAVHFAPNITVNAVSPGLILPPPGKDESYLKARVDTVPMAKHGSPKDIANAVIFLLKNRFVTGETIHVDGGRHLQEYESRPNPH